MLSNQFHCPFVIFATRVVEVATLLVVAYIHLLKWEMFSTRRLAMKRQLHIRLARHLQDSAVSPMAATFRVEVVQAWHPTATEHILHHRTNIR